MRDLQLCVTGNEAPNRPSVAGTASGTERNDTQDRQQERKTGTCGSLPALTLTATGRLPKLLPVIE